MQRIPRDSVRAQVRPHVVLAPIGERIEFRQTVRRVELLDRDVLARHALRTAQPGDPGPRARERPAQRLALADAAALLAQIDAV